MSLYPFPSSPLGTPSLVLCPCAFGRLWQHHSSLSGWAVWIRALDSLGPVRYSGAGCVGLAGVSESEEGFYWLVERCVHFPPHHPVLSEKWSKRRGGENSPGRKAWSRWNHWLFYLGAITFPFYFYILLKMNPITGLESYFKRKHDSKCWWCSFPHNVTLLGKHHLSAFLCCHGNIPPNFGERSKREEM